MRGDSEVQITDFTVNRIAGVTECAGTLYFGAGTTSH